MSVYPSFRMKREKRGKKFLEVSRANFQNRAEIQKSPLAAAEERAPSLKKQLEFFSRRTANYPMEI
jgi:hypothetical protein